ncbi:MAG: DUF2191 domain-containing protein [Candidatus Omnitrophota bacterium]|jgi:hypothetical protein|nr:MAG: DUF2191 domain-containing protein [Candidatus Omnitrophota bacterium]
MRTTLPIDDDVLDKAKAVATKHQTPFRRVVNEALRIGLQAIENPPPNRPYHSHPYKMGLKAGRNPDNIQELLAQIEGEDQR